MYTARLIDCPSMRLGSIQELDSAWILVALKRSLFDVSIEKLDKSGG
jgi:hypothetical protein